METTMKPIAEWRRVLRHAWSVRFIILAVALSGVEAALPFLDGILPVSPGTFALLSFLATGAALAARFVAQPRTLPGDSDE